MPLLFTLHTSEYSDVKFDEKERLLTTGKVLLISHVLNDINRKFYVVILFIVYNLTSQHFS